MTDTSISAGKAVAIHFNLKLDNGEVIDSSEGQEPMLYLHGHGNIVPGLEAQLDGKGVGDKIQADVAPAEGFGEKLPENVAVQELPRADFPAGVEFEIGMQFGFEGEDGQVMPGWVTALTDETVTIDLNHPLAGEALHFDVEVCEIREATAEELEHGHPHGPGGHDH